MSGFCLRQNLQAKTASIRWFPSVAGHWRVAASRMFSTAVFLSSQAEAVVQWVQSALITSEPRRNATLANETEIEKQ